MIKHDTLLLTGSIPENRRTLRAMLDGRYNLLEAISLQQALMLLEQNLGCIAAVLLDIADPESLSLETLTPEALQELFHGVPVITIAPDDSQQTLEKAFGFGASDVIPMGYDQYAMVRRIENIVELSLHKRNLEELVREQSDILRHSNDVMVDALSSIIEYRSVESGQHILRIRHFTQILLEEVARGCPEYGLTEQDIRIISSASALHDIGKIAIPDAILTKPGKLTEEEWAVMKTHALTGCKILQSLGDMGNAEYLRYAHNICHYHHERWDGGGYPEGLSGENIPICAQVVGLADVYDALTSKRVYKDAYSFETAVNMILMGECGAFSPKLLECFKRVMKQYEALARDYADGLSPKSEEFDVFLPPPEQEEENSSVTVTRAKYLTLVHYINGFLIELDLDQSLFHLIYNPYPELTRFRRISSLADIEQLVMDLVVPQERERMAHFIQEDISRFMSRGHRRYSAWFHFRGSNSQPPELYEITLLRINPNSPRRTLAALCRKADNQSTREAAPQTARRILSDSTYVCRFDRDFTLVRLSENTHSLAGYTLEELRQQLDSRLIRLVYPQDRELVRAQFREQLSRGTSVALEHRVQRRDGSVLWVLHRSRLVVEEDGQENLYCFLTDITDSKRENDILTERLRRYEIILAQTENVLFEWDLNTDRISFSDTWESIFGFAPISQSVREALLSGSFFHPDDLPLLLDRVRALEEGSHYEMVEARIATARGRYLWCRFRASALRDAAGNLQTIAGIILNIDADKQAERALQDRAERDALTKLLNKQAGYKHTEEYLAQFPQGVSCALLIIDLDDFKQVNDQYGHLFGDAVLTRAAREIKKLFRTQDILARIGGDEFMVLMRGVSDRALVESRCSRLLEAFRTVFREQGHKLSLGCSIGAALAPEHGKTFYDLFQHADQALYQAKAKGKNLYMFYDGADDTFRTSKQRTTTINNRIESDEQPGLADNSIVQYAFQRLYSAKNVDAAVNDILRLAGELMNVSRVYIFENSDDNRHCSNTYEWCNAGIDPEIRNLQHISYEEDIPGYRESYDERGILYCSDIAELPQAVYDILAPQGIQSLLHCAIREGGVFRGYIGFDDCITQRLWTKEQIDALTYLSETLSVFLLKKRAQDKTAQRASDLSSILDNQNAWIYIIDPDTCRLKYLNAKTRALAPQVSEGMLCHKALMGLPERCPNCPSAAIRQTKTDSALIRNNQFDIQVLAEATLIQWEGTESCLLTCREFPAVQNTPKKSPDFEKCNAE
nr:diguanylate cyclase [Oscillospiraceae bacterium]